MGYINSILNLTSDVVSFPIRYIGSKRYTYLGGACKIVSDLFKKYAFSKDIKIENPWSNNVSKLTSSDVIKGDFLVFGCLNAAVHKSDNTWSEAVNASVLNPNSFDLDGSDPILDFVEMRENCFFNPTMGLKIMMFERNDQLIISFGGMGSHSSELNLNEESGLDNELDRMAIKTGVGNLLGITPDFYESANQLVSLLLNSKFRKNLPKEVHLTGQCLGGSLASYVALKQGLSATCLNTLPLGAGLQNNIPKERLLNADKFVTHVISRGDLLADCNIFFVGFVVKIIDFVCSRIFGIKTPGNFGKVFKVQNETSKFYTPKKLIQVHQLVLGSMIEQTLKDEASDDFISSPEFKKIQDRVERYKNKEIVNLEV